MATTTIRISREMREVLRLAAREGTPMREVLEKAIDAYRRKRVLEIGNRAYAALKDDPKAWEQELAERKLWENTLVDGLTPAPDATPFARSPKPSPIPSK